MHISGFILLFSWTEYFFVATDTAGFQDDKIDNVGGEPGHGHGNFRQMCRKVFVAKKVLLYFCVHPAFQAKNLLSLKIQTVRASSASNSDFWMFEKPRVDVSSRFVFKQKPDAISVVIATSAKS